jgi:ABC-type phosphate/phosphonate transport system substrate-binding protein
MNQEQIDDIVFQASDSHQSLRDWWMSQNQVDLAFCSAVDFVLQRGNYQPLFQFRGHSYNTGGNPHFHRGVIFVNNRSSFFTSELPASILGRALAGREIAMVGHSAAGYFYPSLKLASLTSNTLPRRPVFCGSSEEVVKYVISGITEAGACEKTVLQQVLHQHGLIQSEVVRVILETDLIPTDPVAIQERWLPRKSLLGRELKKALREFFRRPEHGLPRLEDTNADAYADIRENLKKFQGLASK